MADIINNNVDKFLKTTSFTGNTIIDSLIIASIVPIFIAYINGLFGLIKKVFGYFFETLYAYVEDKLKTKFIGKIVCSITISEENRLFSHIKEIIFNPTIHSDIDDNIFKRICTLGSQKDDDKFNKYKHFDRFKMSLDYSGDRLFLLNKNYSITNIDTKIFTYKDDFYIKISLQNTGTKNDAKDTKDTNNSLGNQVMIELITIKSLKSTNDYEYANEIETFLLEKFNIHKSINYVYSIKIIDSTLINSMNNFIGKGYISQVAGNLKYGDGQFQWKNENIIDNKNAPSSILATVKNRNLSSDENLLKENIVLMNGGNDLTEGTNGFYTLYNKYISKTMIQSLQSYGYYFDNNKLIILYYASNTFYVQIVSTAVLLKETDIKQILQYIISTGMNTLKPALNVKANKSNVSVYKYGSGNWMAYGLDRRTFESIFIQNNTMNAIKREIENFIRIEKLYRECDIPYRKGILLYGPPGTGKTSFVKAIAYEYQMSVYMININDSTINDDTIIDMINSIGGSGNRILLFEDIDSAFSKKEEIKFGKKEEIELYDNVNNDDDKNIDVKQNNNNKNKIRNNMQTKYLTYSGLINALDGVLSNQHGVITIMTTNYLNKLGDALIRPGRIDHKYELGPCDFKQIVHMTEYIIKKSIELIKSNGLENIKIENNYEDDELNDKIAIFANKLVDEQQFSKIKPCKLQQYILKNIENIDSIFDNWEELLND